MATNIIVNPTELENVAGRIDTKNTALKEKLDEFAKKFDEISQTWESSASRKTMDAINSLKPHFQEYFDVVSSYAVQMKAIAQEYSEKEQSNVTSANTTADFI